MHSNGEINRVRSRPVPGRKGPGRAKKTWEECVKQDLKVCGLSEAGTQDRLSWRSSVKNSRQEPTPSNGSLLQSMAEPPARRVLGMRTRSFNKTGFDWLMIDWDRPVFERCQTLLHPELTLWWSFLLADGHHKKPHNPTHPIFFFFFFFWGGGGGVCKKRGGCKKKEKSKKHKPHLHQTLTHEGLSKMAYWQTTVIRNLNTCTWRPEQNGCQ